MKSLRIVLLLVLSALLAQTAVAAGTAAPMQKNWTAPEYKIKAQALVDELMARNPSLLSVTFHGTPPGASKLYTMFAGTWPDRIGKVSSEDDVMVIENGFTIIDPRWNKKDPEPKFLVLVPLRDAQARSVGCIVFAFKNSAGGKSDLNFLQEANMLRDGLQAHITDHDALFARAD
jgi:hypothetical protein